MTDRLSTFTLFHTLHRMATWHDASPSRFSSPASNCDLMADMAERLASTLVTLYIELGPAWQTGWQTASPSRFSNRTSNCDLHGRQDRMADRLRSFSGNTSNWDCSVPQPHNSCMLTSSCIAHIEGLPSLIRRISLALALATALSLTTMEVVPLLFRPDVAGLASAYSQATDSRPRSKTERTACRRLVRQVMTAS